MDSKLPFNEHLDHIFSQSMKLLGLFPTIRYSFSTLYCLVLCFTFMRPKIDYASVSRNSVTSAHTHTHTHTHTKLERIQRKFDFCIKTVSLFFKVLVLTTGLSISSFRPYLLCF